MAKPTYRAWLQDDGTYEWWVPLSAQNTQLRFGQFRALFAETLRPARDRNDEPLTGFLDTGHLRAQVMMGSGPRHVDVFAKPRSGARLLLTVSAPAAGTEVPPILGTAELTVSGVRAQRLCDLAWKPAWIRMSEHTDWSSPTTRLEHAHAAQVVWDRLLASHGPPVQRRNAYQQNPWVWVFRLREE